MILPSTLAAIRQVASPRLRGLLLRTLGFTALLLGAIWFGLTRAIDWLLKAHPLSRDYPVVDGFVFFMAGAGLVILLVYLLPAVSALVAGFFLDDAAEAVELADFPSDPPGTPLPVGRGILYGLRFAGLAILVNFLALVLFFVPGVNLIAFFAANSYLLGREYFEMAAARFRPIPEAVALRRAHRGTVMAAGAVMAALMLVPILNLATPIFGIALMVHLHKRIAADPRRRLPQAAAS